MSEQQIFNAPDLNLDHLAQSVANWYKLQKFDVQVVNVPGEGSVVQARQKQTWRSALGMSSTLNICLRYKESNLIAEIGAGTWSDKAVVGGIGAFVVWPLLFTAAYGAWRQSRLPQRTFEFIQSYVGGNMMNSGYYSPPSHSPQSQASETNSSTTRNFCENCGASLSSGANFCFKCGSKVV